MCAFQLRHQIWLIDVSDFACSQIAPGLKPDVLIMAKGIANGFPLSGQPLALRVIFFANAVTAGIVTRKELSDMQPVGSMGGT